MTRSSNIPIAEYRDLIFINETTGCAIANGLFIKTTDGGITWTFTMLPTDIYLRKIQFTDTQTGYIIGGDNNHGVLLKTEDGGENWRTINLNSALEHPEGMYFLNNNTGFITGKNLFIKTTDGGQTWISIKSNAFRIFNSVNFKNSNEGVATSSNGVYFKTTNGGVSWDSLQYNTTDYLYNIHFAENTTFVTTNANTTVLDLNNNREIIKFPMSLSGLVFFDTQKSIAVGYQWEEFGFFPYGHILLTNDGWATYDEKGIGRSSVIAKMSDEKIMIICNAEVMILKR
jgi:photosystem II stability/assembly factor-like uncharacterized protein